MRVVGEIAMYNMAPRIEEKIRSLKNQSPDTFRCLIDDDLSTDDSISRAHAGIGDDGRFQSVAHTEKKIFDGQYRGTNRTRRHGCWMTYGSYSGPNMPREAVCRPYRAGRCVITCSEHSPGALLI